MIKKLHVKDLMFFDNDDQFIDYCLSSSPTIFNDDDGIPYYDYEFNKHYVDWVNSGKGFVIRDPKSLVFKRGCVYRGMITKPIRNVYTINEE